MSKGKNLIYVGPADGAEHKALHVEGVALAAILPGTVVEFNSSGTGLQANASASTTFGSQLFVADRDQMRQRSIDTAWAVNENMVAVAPRSGEFVNVLVITGQALNNGEALSRSATPGALKIALTNGTEQIVGYSDEKVTTTATQLVRVRIA